MIFSEIALLAQTSAPAASHPASQPAGGLDQFLRSPLFVPLILIAVFLYFSSRSRSKRDRDARDMLNSIKKGDRVQTIGGILGTVVEARENEVVLKVDETNNTKMRFSRKAIHTVLQDEAEKKPS